MICIEKDGETMTWQEKVPNRWAMSALSKEGAGSMCITSGHPGTAFQPLPTSSSYLKPGGKVWRLTPMVIIYKNRQSRAMSQDSDKHQISG